MISHGINKVKSSVTCYLMLILNQDKYLNTYNIKSIRNENEFFFLAQIKKLLTLTPPRVKKISETNVSPKLTYSGKNKIVVSKNLAQKIYNRNWTNYLKPSVFGNWFNFGYRCPMGLNRDVRSVFRQKLVYLNMNYYFFQKINISL